MPEGSDKTSTWGSGRSKHALNQTRAFIALELSPSGYKIRLAYTLPIFAFKLYFCGTLGFT